MTFVHQKRRQSPADTLTRRLCATLSRTSIQYGLLKPDDRILVALSGGKDSYTLLHLMKQLTQKLPFRIHLLAVHVHGGKPGHDPSPLVQWLKQSEVPFDIAEQDTFSTVQANLKDGETPCSICSRLRRGVLYTWAEKHGCNKIALGHHREDTLATFMMNLCYSGRLQAMPPRYTTDDGRFEIIRPMIEIPQDDIIALARALEFPIIPCTTCSEIPNHRRKYMESLLHSLESENPKLKSVMLGALKHVRPTHLFDLTVQRIKPE
jgi:tRNA 2-thiocytidine biosynthesis protein TtcA